MLPTLLVIGGILAAVITIFAIIWFVRVRNFKPTKNKKLQQQRLNSDLEPTGFAYHIKGDYFYSLMDCWQRDAGYCRLYDEGAPLFNMIMDCEPVAFHYGGKRWLIEFWKGQYGITTGAEIGVYNTSRPDLDTEKVKGTFFESAGDAERLPLSFVLRKNGAVILKRKARHWWLTGFRLGEFSETDSLTMDIRIKFPNKMMRGAFVESLQKLGYRPGEFSVSGTTVRIHYTNPHSPQPASPESIQTEVVQKVNESNCTLYQFSTAQYADSLDKLEYLKTAMPELYHLFLKSLYAKGFFAAFDIIQEALHEQDAHPKPTPPQPPCRRPCTCVREENTCYRS